MSRLVGIQVLPCTLSGNTRWDSEEVGEIAWERRVVRGMVRECD